MARVLLLLMIGFALQIGPADAAKRQKPHHTASSSKKTPAQRPSEAAPAPKSGYVEMPSSGGPVTSPGY